MPIKHRDSRLIRGSTAVVDIVPLKPSDGQSFGQDLPIHR